MEESVEAWFLGLTVAEIVMVALAFAQIPPASKRTKKKLFAAIAELPQGVQDKIRDAALARPRRKRKRKDTDQNDTPTKRKKMSTVMDLEDEDIEEDPPVSLLEGPFLRAPTKEVIRSCTERYIDGTSNKALEKQTCLICARLLPMDETQEIDFDDLPNKRLLIPLYPHPAHRLRDIYLIHEDVMDDATTYICHECYTHLNKDTRPSLALSNAMWIGRIPLQLEILTLPERILISLYFPAVFVVKLFPKGRNEHTWNQNTVNSGMKGNVSTYRLHRADIASLVSGKTMPPTAAILSATIGVTFVGAKNVPLRILPVSCATKAERLPWNAVPDEILETTRYDEDRTRLDAEQAGYVPVYDEEFECGDVGTRRIPLKP
ncbi:hypothetical protein C8R47DRAFT_1068862 [Mycena vitilis]|nr:hypothetical protein C8R47DRAFT_1068862 [Mycena vitilis]